MVERAESERRNDQLERSAIPSKEVLGRILGTKPATFVTVIGWRRGSNSASRRRENAKINSGRNSDAESPRDTQFAKRSHWFRRRGIAQGPSQRRTRGANIGGHNNVAIEKGVTGGDQPFRAHFAKQSEKKIPCFKHKPVFDKRLAKNQVSTL